MMTLARAAEWCGGELIVPAGAESAMMTGASIDTRELNRGDLFIALPGANADGADFIPEAARLGACAALRARGSWVAQVDSEIALPQIVVADPARALAELARRWRRKVSAPKVIAVTGTNGKTTTREIAAAILRAQFGAEAVLSPARNFNNHLGVPLTILRLRDSHRAAVLEMGMSRAGDIDFLARIAAPDIGIITNAGRGHLEELGTVENVAFAKGELIENLPPNGVAVFNSSDEHFHVWSDLAEDLRSYSFGIADSLAVNSGDAVIVTPEREFLRAKFPSDLPRHMILNALAACAALREFNVSDEAMSEGLENFHAAPGRMEFKTAKGGATLIDDSYNANPDSVLAALEVLETHPAPRVAALGDMLELGEASAELHREIGVRIGEGGAVSLLAFGPDSRETAEAARENGCEDARHFSDKSEMIRELTKTDRPGATILVKGSRGMRMDEVARALEEGR